MVKIINLPDSAFPSEPDKDNLCLVCREPKMRFSWFCSKECEKAFIKEHKEVKQCQR